MPGHECLLLQHAQGCVADIILRHIVRVFHIVQLNTAYQYYARNLQAIQDHAMFCVINATRLDVGCHPDLPPEITRIRVPIDDNGNRDHDIDLFLALPYVIQRIDIHLFLGQAVLTHR